ncbi:hypothetical protein [Amycolatopsis sp. H20-H5]|uniref:hypothetical protein n=1 Tax=Amycolatopsis sp. H20-H5 TaxID=3046309 RepID=UPI002DBBF74F|nr:hypothetical protein [Amycolatopsis sp. H20-H5]MEC3977883.1 hypothetical protein [Amycolatopsis sp. H20-H5]
MNLVRSCLLRCKSANGLPYRAAPGRYACDQCTERLAQILAELVTTYTDMTEVDELVPGGGPDNPGGRQAPGPRSPAVDALLVHTDPRSVTDSGASPAALASIAGWARIVREEQTVDVEPEKMLGTVPTGRVTMAREAQTLRFNWHWIMAQPWLDDFADELRQVLNALRTVRRLNVPTLRVGTCPAVADDGFKCGASLSVRVDAVLIRCRGCGAHWPQSRWHELGDARADYAQLSEDLGVPVGSLYRWAGEDGWTISGTRARRLVNRADALASYARRRGPLFAEQAG